ncbi:branched-chain amino acid transport system permease protein [Desulfohalotomaculum tongense]|uniref:branched-chain amino acid ABC transporter permease n=1 Tax=Desulforadius tongensis TaxID=1216062 RepID=UPI00195DBCA8|nr:branched-chain amino acid ABC transporter permease [Desulforadius tongensis]MBM7853948.1 branched-chain amino acid transport system permease protein [Desulforadius tongensis]
MTLETFLQNIANGISLGSLYALIAIGYTMVYGIIRLINFAHADLLMVASYAAFYGILVFALPWWVSFLLAIVITTILGISIEKIAYRPLRDAPRISALISAIGVSFLLENLGIVLLGARPKPFPRPEEVVWNIHLGGISFLSLAIIIPVITLVLLIAVNLIVNKTNVGIAMRAVSRDFETASLMAVDVNKVVVTTFAVGSGLAAVGGIMWSLQYPQIDPLMGVFPGLKCFIAAVMGGIGSVPGAMIGGFILGMGEVMLVGLMPELSGYRDAFAFVVLILILLFKPGGILGEHVVEKV